MRFLCVIILSTQRNLNNSKITRDLYKKQIHIKPISGHLHLAVRPVNLKAKTTANIFRTIISSPARQDRTRDFTSEQIRREGRACRVRTPSTVLHLYTASSKKTLDLARNVVISATKSAKGAKVLWPLWPLRSLRDFTLSILA